jgi:hypothetical protein
MCLPIRDDALNAAERAARQARETRAVIEAFLEAEGFTEQRTNVVSDTQKLERRLVGPWSEIP